MARTLNEEARGLLAEIGLPPEGVEAVMSALPAVATMGGTPLTKPVQGCPAVIVAAMRIEAEELAADWLRTHDPKSLSALRLAFGR
jgi:hypothetical protein